MWPWISHPPCRVGSRCPVCRGCRHGTEVAKQNGSSTDLDHMTGVEHREPDLLVDRQPTVGFGVSFQQRSWLGGDQVLVAVQPFGVVDGVVDLSQPKSSTTYTSSSGLTWSFQWTTSISFVRHTPKRTGHEVDDVD